MDNQASFGSGSALLGDTSALQEAISRRQSGSGQVSASAPTYNPSTAPVAPTTASAPGMAPSPQPAGNPATPAPQGMAQTPGESQIILKALSERLKSLSKLAEQTGGQVGV